MGLTRGPPCVRVFQRVEGLGLSTSGLPRAALDSVIGRGHDRALGQGDKPFLKIQKGAGSSCIVVLWGFGWITKVN